MLSAWSVSTIVNVEFLTLLLNKMLVCFFSVKMIVSFEKFRRVSEADKTPITIAGIPRWLSGKESTC